VPFFFSATPVGASLLILEATAWNFVIATLTSVAALFFLSLGIVGQFRVPLYWSERTLLICSAAVMAVCPFNESLEGLLPLVLFRCHRPFAPVDIAYPKTPFHLRRCLMISRGLKKLSVVTAVAALLGVAFFVPQPVLAQGKLSFSIATGGTGGVWYP